VSVEKFDELILNVLGAQAGGPCPKGRARENPILSMPTPNMGVGVAIVKEF
jgi:hypothetical protein